MTGYVPCPVTITSPAPSEAAQALGLAPNMACGGATESLEIDHRDPALKVDHRIWSWTRERLEEELAKCEPRCAPCHRTRHGEQRKRHGIRRYEAGCRCDTCRSAKSRKNLTNRRNRAQRERAFEEGRLF